MTLTDLRTPAVLIDKSRAVANIDRMQSAANAHGVRLRPHSKTHKSPVVAAWQIERGAVGICCAKLGEAEVFADAGIADIRLPYPLNPANADRVIALARRVHLSFIVDHPGVARGWSDALSRAGVEVDVLVKIDVGFHRCGIDPSPSTAVPFILEVAAQPGLRFRGLLSHAGQAYHAGSEADLQAIARHEAAILTELAAGVRAGGVQVDELSAGATPTARFSLGQEGVTEYRPGNYVYFDRTQVGLGAARLEDCALTVLARVVSKPAADRLVFDSGSKTLTNDGGRGFVAAPGYGVVLRDAAANQPSPRLRRSAEALAEAEAPALHGTVEGTAIQDDSLLIERLSEEHATVKVLGGHTDLVPGDLVRILPNHSCVVSNLVDQAWILEGDTVTPLPIAARGRIA